MLITQAKEDYLDFFTLRGQSAHEKVVTPYPHGESHEQAARRTRPLIEEILASDTEVTVIIGHQVVNRVLISGLTQESLESQINYYQEHREIVEIDLDAKTVQIHNIDTPN